MKLKLKIIIPIILSVIALIIIGTLTYKFINSDKLYKEYKTKCETEITNSGKLNDQVKDLQAQVETYKKDKTDLLQQIKDATGKIIYKEKIVYKDGQLIIPEDYNDLKNNYSSLSDLYLNSKTTIDLLNGQIEKDGALIEKLGGEVESLNVENKKLVDLLKNPVSKSKLYEQMVLGGVIINSSGGLNGFAGYQGIVFGKIAFQVQVQLPTPGIGVGVGIKF